MRVDNVSIRRIDNSSVAVINPNPYQGASIGDLLEVTYDISILTGGFSVIGSTFEFNVRLYNGITDETNYSGGYIRTITSMEYLSGTDIEFTIRNCGANYLQDLNPSVFLRMGDVSGTQFQIIMRMLVCADTDAFQDCNNFLLSDRLTKNDFDNAVLLDNSVPCVFNQNEYINAIFRITDTSPVTVATTDDQIITAAFWEKEIYDQTPSWECTISSNATNSQELNVFSNSTVTFFANGTANLGINDVFIGMMQLNTPNNGTLQSETGYSYVDATTVAAFVDYSDYIRGSANVFFYEPSNTGLSPVGINSFNLQVDIEGCELTQGEQYLIWCLFHSSRDTGFSFSVAGEDGQPRGVFQDTNGDYWVVGNGSNTVYKYDSGGAYTGTSFSVGAEDGTPEGITSDGLNFYVVGSATNAVYQYTLAGAYTGTSFSVNAEQTLPSGITYQGGNLYVVGRAAGNKTVHEYSLAGVYSGFNFDVSTEDANPEGVGYNGSKFWLVGRSTDKIYEYTAAGVFTGNEFDTSGIDGAMFGLFWDVADGYLYLVGGNNDTIYRIWETNPAPISCAQIFTAATSDIPGGCFPALINSNFIDYTKTWPTDHIITSVQDRIRSQYFLDKISYDICIGGTLDNPGSFDDYFTRLDVDFYDKNTAQILDSFSVNYVNGAFENFEGLITITNDPTALDLGYEFRIRHDDTNAINDWAGREVIMDARFIFRYENVQPLNCGGLISYEDILQIIKQIDVRDYDNFDLAPVITAFEFKADGIETSIICSDTNVIQACALAPVGYDVLGFIDDGFNYLALEEEESYTSPTGLDTLTSAFLSNVDPDTTGGDACMDVSATLFDENKNYRVSMIVKPI